MPKISIIIPLYNAEKYIEECLLSIINAPPQNKEIIVIDNNSTDKGPEIVSKFKEVKLVHETKRGPSAARNRGIKEATGDILLFLDDDLIIERNYIKEILSTFNEDKKILAVGGFAHSYDKNSIISLSHEVRLMGYSPSKKGIIEVKTIPTMTFSTSKRILDEVGVFDENLMGAEDYDICLRIRNKGYKCVMNSNAVVYHHNPTNFNSLIKRWFKYGIMWVQANRKHKISSEIMNTIIWFSTLMISIVLSLINIKFVFLAVFIFILPWLIFYSVDTLRYLIKNKKLEILLFPFIHQALILSRSFGIIYEALKFKR